MSQSCIIIGEISCSQEQFNALPRGYRVRLVSTYGRNWPVERVKSIGRSQLAKMVMQGQGCKFVVMREADGSFRNASIITGYGSSSWNEVEQTDETKNAIELYYKSRTEREGHLDELEAKAIEEMKAQEREQREEWYSDQADAYRRSQTDEMNNQGWADSTEEGGWSFID